jgi:hypothetical protein
MKMRISVISDFSDPRHGLFFNKEKDEKPTIVWGTQVSNQPQRFSSFGREYDQFGG